MDCKWKLARILSSSFPTFPNLLPWLWWETPMYGFQWWEDAYNRSGRQVHNPIMCNCTICKVGLNTERMTQVWETIPGHIHSMENPLIQCHWISFGNFCDIKTNSKFQNPGKILRAVKWKHYQARSIRAPPSPPLTWWNIGTALWFWIPNYGWYCFIEVIFLWVIIFNGAYWKCYSKEKWLSMGKDKILSQIIQLSLQGLQTGSFWSLVTYDVRRGGEIMWSWAWLTEDDRQGRAGLLR